MFNATCYARVWRNNRPCDELNVARSCCRCYHDAKRSLVIVSTLVLRLKAAEFFLETSECTLRTQERESAEKSGLRDAKRADFIRYIGLKNPVKPKILKKKNIRNHSCHQFYPVLAKIQINRGLLCQFFFPLVSFETAFLLNRKWLLPSFCGSQGRIQRGAIAPPKTYESTVTLFTMILYNSENNIRDTRPFCRPLFCHSSVVKYVSSLLQYILQNDAWLPSISEIAPPPTLLAAVRPWW